MRGLTAIGDIIVDYSPVSYSGKSAHAFEANVGGTAANCAVAASRLGTETMLVGKTGDDFMGAYSRQVFAASGVDTRMMPTDPETFTSHTFVSLDNGERSFSFSIFGSAYLNLRLSEIDINELLDTRMLYVSGMNFVQDPISSATRELMDRAHAKNVTIVLDMNYRAFLFDGAQAFARVMDSLLPFVDVFKGSREEFEIVFGSDDLDVVGSRIVSAGPRLVVMTEDIEGASYFRKSDSAHVGTVPAAVVDTTGAGDCFMGAFVACIDRCGGLDAMTEDDFTEALAFSNAAAAICTEDLGAIDPMPHIQDVFDRRRATDLQTAGR